MKKLALLTMLTLCVLSLNTQAQSSKFRKKVKQEITTYAKAFTHEVIFEVSRYFRMRGEVLGEVRVQFRGMKVIRKQLSANTCIYEFAKKHHRLILPENEVRKLVDLPPALPMLLARKPTN